MSEFASVKIVKTNDSYTIIYKNFTFKEIILTKCKFQNHRTNTCIFLLNYEQGALIICKEEK